MKLWTHIRKHKGIQFKGNYVYIGKQRHFQLESLKGNIAYDFFSVEHAKKAGWSCK